MKSHVLIFRATDMDKFMAIKDGLKTIETRAATPRYARIAEGDLLTFKCADQYAEKRVDHVNMYKSVKELVDAEDIAHIFPGVSTLEEAEATYHGFPGYKEKIAESGLVAFHLTDYVRIRPMRKDDMEGLEPMAHANLKHWYGGRFRAFRDWMLEADYRTAWVAELDGRPVGFAIISDKPDTDYAKLSAIVVDPSMQKRGVGEHLLKQSEDYSRASNNMKIIATIAEDNEYVKGFAERNGFEITGTLTNKYRPGKAELVYCKMIH